MVCLGGTLSQVHPSRRAQFLTVAQRSDDSALRRRGVFEAVKSLHRMKGYAALPQLVAVLRARDQQLGFVTASQEKRVA
jgi:hypothetical protein